MRLEIRSESDARQSNPPEIALKSFQCTKLWSRVGARCDRDAAASQRSEHDCRLAPHADRDPPPRRASTGTPTHARHAHSHASEPTTRTHTPSPTDKQHKNTTPRDCTHRFPVALDTAAETGDYGNCVCSAHNSDELDASYYRNLDNGRVANCLNLFRASGDPLVRSSEHGLSKHSWDDLPV